MEATTTEASGPVETVSCTVVRLFDAHGLESHNFLDLAVPAADMVLRFPNSFSVDLSSLLSSIITKARLSDPLEDIPPLMYNVLTESHRYPKMRIATTSLPVFDGWKQNPGFGYQNLGRFESYAPIRILSTRIHSIAIQHQWDRPEVLPFKRTLESLGIHEERHFILMLSDCSEQYPPTIYPVPLQIHDPPTSRHSSTHTDAFPTANFDAFHPHSRSTSEQYSPPKRTAPFPISDFTPPPTPLFSASQAYSPSGSMSIYNDSASPPYMFSDLSLDCKFRSSLSSPKTECWRSYRHPTPAHVLGIRTDAISL